eukprot:369365-Hanusia_phi.AAC.1
MGRRTELQGIVYIIWRRQVFRFSEHVVPAKQHKRITASFLLFTSSACLRILHTIRRPDGDRGHENVRPRECEGCDVTSMDEARQFPFPCNFGTSIHRVASETVVVVQPAVCVLQ